MRQLIMWNLVSLDGYFEGTKSWELDWHGYVWGDELERLHERCRRAASSFVAHLPGAHECHGAVPNP